MTRGTPLKPVVALPSRVPVALSYRSMRSMSEASRSIGYLDGIARSALTEVGTLTVSRYEAVATASLAHGPVDARQMRDRFTKAEQTRIMPDPARAAAGSLQAMLGLTGLHWGRWATCTRRVIGKVIYGQESALQASEVREQVRALADDIAFRIDHSDTPPLVQAATATIAVASISSDPSTAMLARHLGLVVLARSGGCVDGAFPPVSWGLLSHAGAWETIATALEGDASRRAERVDDALDAYFQAIAHAAFVGGFIAETASSHLQREGGSGRTRSNELTPSQEAVLVAAIGLSGVSMRQLLALTGLTHRTLKRAVRTLEARGSIIVREAAHPLWTVVRPRRPVPLHLDCVKSYPTGVGRPFPARSSSQVA